jgi:hypothetical protein
VWNHADPPDQVSRYSDQISTLPTEKEDTHDFVTEVPERSADSVSESGTEKGAERSKGREKLDVGLERRSAFV